MVIVLYLVRHAHADWAPDEGRPLSDRGGADAHRVAEVLQRYPIDAIYSSPFCRARQTIGPLAVRLGLPVHVEPALRERRLAGGPVQGFLQAVEATWRDPSFAHPGGESNAAAQQRGLRVVRKLQARCAGEHIVLSTHGNLLALILHGFDPSIGFGFWRALTMPDIYTLRVTQGEQATIRRLWPGSDSLSCDCEIHGGCGQR
jgi:2,3-bisphosphoglycerate-dependent phosphoglycerate mutase